MRYSVNAEKRAVVSIAKSIRMVRQTERIVYPYQQDLDLET